MKLFKNSDVCALIERYGAYDDWKARVRELMSDEYADVPFLVGEEEDVFVISVISPEMHCHLLPDWLRDELVPIVRCDRTIVKLTVRVRTFHAKIWYSHQDLFPKDDGILGS